MLGILPGISCADPDGGIKTKTFAAALKGFFLPAFRKVNFPALAKKNLTLSHEIFALRKVRYLNGPLASFY